MLQQQEFEENADFFSLFFNKLQSTCLHSWSQGLPTPIPQPPETEPQNPENRYIYAKCWRKYPHPQEPKTARLSVHKGPFDLWGPGTTNKGIISKQKQKHLQPNINITTSLFTDYCAVLSGHFIKFQVFTRNHSFPVARYFRERLNHQVSLYFTISVIFFNRFDWLNSIKEETGGRRFAVEAAGAPRTHGHVRQVLGWTDNNTVRSLNASPSSSACDRTIKRRVAACSRGSSRPRTPVSPQPCHKPF